MCPIARSLDVIGERWALLVVRELLLGPKRFTDLLAVLPAMGTNRLAERLKGLEADGVVAKLPPAYALTGRGEELRPIVLGIGAWGFGLPVDGRIDPGSARAELIALGLAAVSPPERSAGLRESYEFHVGDELFHVVADHGEVVTRSGPAADADLVVECDLPTFMMLADGVLAPSRALRERRARVRGAAPPFTRAFRVLSSASAPGGTPAPPAAAPRSG
jgi:DNA-binding HxlR family transcriptional regulator